LSAGQGAINVAVSLGLFSADVFRIQEHLEGAVSADRFPRATRKPGDAENRLGYYLGQIALKAGA
jgi:hypothetical protein